MEKIRALIADDEALARRRLRQFLAEVPDVEVVGECEDGRGAVELVRTVAPDLLFLDVQMPLLDGFGVIREVGAGNVPAVVFVTAFDQFALRAFEAHALDYLLKPFGRERFMQAVGRARRQIGDANVKQRLDALVGELSERPRYSTRLAVKARGRTVILATDEIDWVGAADNYLELHAGPNSFVVRETLSQLQSKLDPRKFVRIHRSTLVNIERIKELHPLFAGDQVVVLHDGTKLQVSRTHRQRLMALLDEL
ncbi:MAG TPA: LytTR family DNA-binding domain-containing protein [Pyrinomonadaceae bacterium]